MCCGIPIGANRGSLGMVSSLKPSLIDFDYVLNSARNESAISDGSVRIRSF
jgi:hypothetical protein